MHSFFGRVGVPLRSMIIVSLLAAAGSLALATEPVSGGGGGGGGGGGQSGYYRMPTIHGDTIVFVAEGDLWKVSTAGGLAARLTSHPGDELNPAISPDGTTVAFTAQYEGPTEVYTMPVTGGLPTRRTWGSARVNFVGWTPDGRVMYSTREFSTLPSSQIAIIDPKNNAVERVPLYEADQGQYTADGKTLIFTRLPWQGSHTKRYKGGFIQQIWSFNGSAEATPLFPDYTGISKEAMVSAGGRLYFATDRDGIMNLWSSTLDGKDLTQLTKHADYDVVAPEMNNGRIVYQHGADIWLLNTQTGADAAVSITLASDFDQMREQWVTKPQQYISAAQISPDGDRVAITARGRVFVAPAKQGRLVEVTKQSGVRYRSATFSHDGKNILALSDRSGEVEFWSLPANGVGEPSQTTTDGAILRWDGAPSPDGKFLAHRDKDQRLFVTSLEDKTTTLITQSQHGDITDLTWSPDSQWLAFTEPAANTVTQVKLYGMAGKQITPVTTDRFFSASPVFSPDGKWLYFLSDRNIQSEVASPWGPLAPQPYFTKKTKIYHVALKAGTRSPWVANDELMPKDEKKEDKKEEPKKEEPSKEGAAASAGDEKKLDDSKPDAKGDAKTDDKKAKKDKKVEVVIDLEDIQSRIQEVPVKAGNYFGLTMNDKVLFFVAGDLEDEDRARSLQAVKIDNEKPEVKTVAAGIRSYDLSQDGKKILVRKDSTFAIIDAAAAPAELDKSAVDLSGWSLSAVPAEDWKQFYVDGWRLLRDYFYARNMHGVDWPAMRAKYEPLVQRVRSRAELNDVLGQLTGELSTLHHFVRGGDLRQGKDNIGLASLGGVLTRDDIAGGYAVVAIHEFDPDEPDQRPPLARPGVDVKVGDVITQVNGVDTLSAPSIATLLRNQAGKQVLLRVIPAGKTKADARDVIVSPVSAFEESGMRYTSWEVSRRKLVEELGKGDIGYVHLRAMGTGDIAQWTKNFFPVFNRSGLVIDVRRNNGGNIDSWILGQLLRRAWMYWNARVGQPAAWNMQYAFRGHVVVICDNFTASDGEAFAEGFKRLGLGKVIGTRTWGGEVWLSSSNVLSDDGVATAGEFGVYGPEGYWLVEGHGVDPDIVVDNLPHATFKGEDAQLKAAVDHLQKLIAQKPIPPVQAPALPDKSFKK